jgi:hypothetical protein
MAESSCVGSAPSGISRAIQAHPRKPPQSPSPTGGELVERLVARAQGAVGLDEVQPLRATDRAPLVAVQVGDQAVVQGVHGEPDAALGQLGQGVAHDPHVRGVVACAPDGLVGDQRSLPARSAIATHSSR